MVRERRKKPVLKNNCSASGLPTWEASSARHVNFAGERYVGGFGHTYEYSLDYWTLRTRSNQVFNDNLYARGIIRRLVTNEINTGLEVEVQPEEGVLGFQQDELAEWSEDVESRFSLWAKTPEICDYAKRRTFAQLQAEARQAALVSGDVLEILRYTDPSGLPSVQIIPGENIQTPLGRTSFEGRIISYGVEISKTGEHVAFWVLQRDGRFERVPAKNPLNGRVVARMIYGTDNRVGDVRGAPLLSLVLQSLKEIDRYRDAAQRKAMINATLALFVKKEQDKPGTGGSISAGAARRGTITAQDEDGGTRELETTEQLPGRQVTMLAPGEEIQAFKGETDVDFGAFESAIINGVAWALEIPPEVLRLSFQSNYSASQAATNEFKMYLNKVRSFFGASFCQLPFEAWLLVETARDKVKDLGLLGSYASGEYDLIGAWFSTDWSGAIKPSADILKQAKGYELMIQMGLITRARAARELTGTKYSKNVRVLIRENEELAKALQAIGVGVQDLQIEDEEEGGQDGKD